MEAAHEAGLSYGKYMAYLELQALDPDVTPQEVQGMNMREIRNRIEALTEDSGSSGAYTDETEGCVSEENYGNGEHAGNGRKHGKEHHGEGYGHGSERGEELCGS